MFNEATIANFFEVMLFYESACESLGDSVVDLIDYCVRKITYLNSKSLREELDGYTDDDDDKKDDSGINQQKRDIQFSTAVTSITILRYLCEHISSLPLSAMDRILNVHDILILIMPLLDYPPWTKRVNVLLNNIRENGINILNKNGKWLNHKI